MTIAKRVSGFNWNTIAEDLDRDGYAGSGASNAVAAQVCSEGGELILVEQRPRMQSRPMIVPREQGARHSCRYASVRDKGPNGYIYGTGSVDCDAGTEPRWDSSSTMPSNGSLRVPVFLTDHASRSFNTRSTDAQDH